MASPDRKKRSVVATAVLLRLSLGWFMLFDGLEAVMKPGWSAKGFLTNPQMAHTFYNGFYSWFALPANSWWVDPLNMWGITFIGIALLLGVSIRLASWAGALLMILYYFPHYSTLPVVPHGYIIEEHLIYAAAFALIAVLPAAQAFGLANFLRTKTFLGRVPIIRSLI